MIEGPFFEGLNTEATICAYCGYCRAVCPTYMEIGWESCSPRGRIQLTKLLLQGTPLSGEQAKRLYQCTLCGDCTQVCSTRIDLRQFWLEARACLIKKNLLPQGLASTRENIATTGNIYGYQNDERAGWVEYLDEPPDDHYRREKAKVVYFVGCSSSFSPRAQGIAEAFVKVMAVSGVDFTILGEREVCCGYPLLVAGMPAQAQELIEHNVAQILSTGAEVVVFTCPACRLMWKEAYTTLLPGVRLLHASELLPEMLNAGCIQLGGLESTVTYHDPCDLGRNGGVYDPPRQVLAAIHGLRLVEVHERRERGLCCGGGGDLEMVDPALTQRLAVRTASKLAATGAQAIVTACPQCLRVLEKGAKITKPEIEVLDINEIVARSGGLS